MTEVELAVPPTSGEYLQAKCVVKTTKEVAQFSS
jgi:hypothetical protein